MELQSPNRVAAPQQTSHRCSCSVLLCRCPRMEFFSQNHGDQAHFEHPFVSAPTLGEWFSTFSTIRVTPHVDSSH